ncbi:hypothetical protein Tco_0209767 [Tanacetum coccineum]
MWSLVSVLAMISMHSGESHIGDENNNNSMDLLLTGNLFEMSTPNAESLLRHGNFQGNDLVFLDSINAARAQVHTYAVHGMGKIVGELRFFKLIRTTYKRGLDTVEAQLVTYRKNEVLFSEEVVVLKREVGIKQYEINMLKTEFEKVKQEKDGIEFKIEKFDKASKDLDQLLESQITDKSKKGLGYSAVPPPHPLIYNRPNKLDLSYSGLDEFKEPEFKGYGPENSKKESNVVCEKESDNSKENSDKSLVKEQESQVKSSFVEGCESNTSKNVSEVEPKKVRKNNDAPIIEDWVSDDEEQDESMTKPEKKTVIPTAAKIEKTS